MWLKQQESRDDTNTDRHYFLKLRVSRRTCREKTTSKFWFVMVAVIWFFSQICKINFHRGFKEHRECLDENKSLTITTMLVWNSRGKSETRDKWVRALKGCKNWIWRGKQRQKDQSQKSQRIKSGEGWGRTKTLKLCKKWLTCDHKSENHTVVACWGCVMSVVENIAT